MSLTLDQAQILAHLSPHSPELMPISMRHLLASSAVAGLLVLLPVGDANAQDNRNTWGWGTAGGVMLSFIAIAAAGGAVGGSSITSWLLLQRKGKRDDNLETIKSDFTKLSGNVKELDIQLGKHWKTSQCLAEEVRVVRN